MNELKSLLDDVKNLFNQNIEGKYAKSYEESEIDEQDTTVINELNNYRTEVNSFKTNCVECKNYSDNYNYSNTSKNLSTLISSITTYETICNYVVEDIKAASRKAFYEVNQSFMQIESLYRTEISEADSAYTDAVSARSRRNDCINDSEEYNKWDRQYSRLKNECRRHINNAKDKYMQLNDFILSEGMKRVNVDGLQEDISLQSDSSNREKTYTDENGDLITETYDEDGRMTTRTIDSGGTNIITETYDESGKLISEIYTHRKWGTVRFIYEYTYDQNGEVIQKKTDSDGNIRSLRYFHYDGEDLQLDKQYSYLVDGGYSERTYHENGQLEKEINLFSDGSSGYEYTYNEKGIKIEDTRILSDDYCVRKFYDDNGVYTGKEIEAGFDDYRVLSVEDEKGLEIREEFKYNDGRVESREYAYDENGNVISRVTTYKDSDGNVIQPSEWF